MAFGIRRPFYSLLQIIRIIVLHSLPYELEDSQLQPSYTISISSLISYTDHRSVTYKNSHGVWQSLSILGVGSLYDMTDMKYMVNMSLRKEREQVEQ